MESCLKVSIEDKGKIKEHASHISFKQNPKVLRRSLQVTPVIIDMRDFIVHCFHNLHNAKLLPIRRKSSRIRSTPMTNPASREI